MSVECRICDTEIDPNCVLKNRFFLEMYQDVICKWVNLTGSSELNLCQSCMIEVIGFYKFKQISRRNVPEANAADGGEQEATPEVLQSLLDGCKESAALPPEVQQWVDPHVEPVVRIKRKIQRKTAEEKAMAPEEYKKYYFRKMWDKHRQVCTVCGKKFPSKQMEGHMNKHKKLEPYSCTHCGMTFHCKLNMRGHIQRMHSKVQKTFSCQICDSTFRKSVNLRNHMRALHSGDRRDFVCTICGKAFAWKSVLKVHQKTHTREVAYRCHVCSQEFVYRQLYKLHMHKKHPGQPVLDKLKKKDTEELS
uniref:Zinc finger protein 782 n=1 Tax=Culex pipiens TaxID=7175 RepID=A0A8D8BR05_CULPI